MLRADRALTFPSPPCLESANARQSEANTYGVRTLHGFPGGRRRILPRDRLVRLVCHDGRYALPDPNFLSIHAVLSKIWEDTGMQIPFEELEDICHLPQLAPDGSTPIPRICRMS